MNLDKAANLSLTVTNLLGQEVINMDKGAVTAGSYTFTVDGAHLKDGVYFYTVRADNREVTNKMIVR